MNAVPAYGSGPPDAIKVSARVKLRRLQSALWYVRTLRNWPAVLCHRLLGLPLTNVVFRNGVRLTLHDSREGLGAVYEIFHTRAYTWAFSPPAPNGVVVDLGANVGIFSYFAATTLVPNGRVIAVEANPDCVAVLGANLAHEGLNVEVMAGAATVSPGPVAFWIPTKSPRSQGSSANMAPTDRANARAMTVPGLPLGRILERCGGPVELLKIDIEGGEHALVWDTPPALWRDIRRVALELHFGLGTGYPSDASAQPIAARLCDLGYVIRDLQLNQEKDLGFLLAERSSH